MGVLCTGRGWQLSWAVVVTAGKLIAGVVLGGTPRVVLSASATPWTHGPVEHLRQTVVDGARRWEHTSVAPPEGSGALSASETKRLCYLRRIERH